MEKANFLAQKEISREVEVNMRRRLEEKKEPRPALWFSGSSSICLVKYSYRTRNELDCCNITSKWKNE